MIFRPFGAKKIKKLDMENSAPTLKIRQFSLNIRQKADSFIKNIRQKTDPTL